jgi:redox-sensitive bicupin YhaK (pirin superfamily)
MDVIHFTHGATDPMLVAGTRGAHFLPLADGEGDAHIGCVHLDPGATVESPSITHAVALLVVHGRITVTADATGKIAWLSGGMGCVLKRDEAYSLQSGPGAIVLIIEAHTLNSTIRGISTPERIKGQSWPNDALFPPR